jgi:hypothetical protein
LFAFDCSSFAIIDFNCSVTCLPCNEEQIHRYVVNVNCVWRGGTVVVIVPFSTSTSDARQGQHGREEEEEEEKARRFESGWSLRRGRSYGIPTEDDSFDRPSAAGHLANRG